jgi:hypothetical protein
MGKIEIFLQGEGVKDVVLVRVPKDGTVRDLLNAAREHGVHLGGDGDPSVVYIEDAEEAVDPNASLEEAGIRHRGHIHVHRCHRIDVSVNFNARTETMAFPPSATVGRVKKWAVKAFGMSEKDAAEHVLQITGSNVRPDEDIHIGALVTHPEHRISFDLVPKVRVEG